MIPGSAYARRWRAGRGAAVPATARAPSCAFPRVACPASTVYVPDGPSRTGAVRDRLEARRPGVPAEARPRTDHPTTGPFDATVPVAKPR
jgi:hypothetical protein